MMGEEERDAGQILYSLEPYKSNLYCMNRDNVSLFPPLPVYISSLQR